MDYKPTIGLEIHAELKTKTKMFCNSANDALENHPNVNICPICTGQPGTLPVINEEAVKKVILTGLALGCEIEKHTFFERKNYFYPDLPKGYQISQYQKPLCKNGYLEIGGTSRPRKIDIERIHLEEDTGKLIHPEGKNYSLVDFNRAGVPLMELVTKPDIKNGIEVKNFAEEFQLILRYLNVSDADMEKGQMRVEVNISISKGKELGTKVEIKNLNSIKAAADSVDYEIKRQTEVLDSGKKIVQETRGWDENKKRTFSQRQKEESQDYRYFPEPDLPPLEIKNAMIDEIKASLVELPARRRERFKSEYGLEEKDVEIFVKNKKLGDYYEKVATEIDAAAKIEHLKKGSKNIPSSEKHLPGKLHSLAANYIINEFPPLLNIGDTEETVDMGSIKIDPEAFAELMVMFFHKKLSSSAAKTVLKEMAQTGLHPERIIEEKNLAQVSDMVELEKAVIAVMSENLKSVEDYKKGKVESIQFLVGKVMEKTRGKANPQVVKEILEKELRK